MTGTTIHPVGTAKKEYDVHIVDFIWRIRLLDVATGEPIVHTPVKDIDPPEVFSREVLERLGRHPFRVVEDKEISFGDGCIDFTVPFKTLTKFKSSTNGAGKPKKVEPAEWEYVTEIFSVKPGGVTFDGHKGEVFYEIDANEPRYVCVRDEKRYGPSECWPLMRRES